jgi:lysophospholipase L1-like esterase
MNNIDQILGKLEPDLAFVFLGANDAVYSNTATSVGVQKYIENLRSIVGEIRKRQPYSSFGTDKESIILVTPPPIHEEQLRERYRERGQESNRDNQRTGSYAEAVRELGREMRLSVVDTYIGMAGLQEGREGEDMRGSYLSDGLHLNTKGNQRMLELVVNTIGSDLPAWMPENLPNDVFPWSALAQ